MDSSKLISRASQLASGKEERDFVKLMERRQAEDGKLSDRQKTLLERVISKHSERPESTMVR